MRLVHSSFPRGFPAAGLLILRLVFGALAEIQGWRLLSGPAEVPGLERFLGAGAMVLGAAIQLGVLTSLAASFLGLSAIVAAAVGGGHGNEEVPVITLGVVSVCIVIALTGSGAYSLDALLFGPREIVLPPSVKPGKPR